MDRKLAAVILLCCLAFVSCGSGDGNTATDESPSPTVTSPSPTPGASFSDKDKQAFADWLRPKLPQMLAVATSLTSLKSIKREFEQNRPLFTNVADSAAKLSAALRQPEPPPGPYNADATALIAASDQVEQAAREAASCTSACDPIYQKLDEANKTFSETLSRVVGILSKP